jgi:hypothetical protein
VPIAGVSLVLALALASSGRTADSRPTPRASAVLQYTELVPTAEGPAAPGTDERVASPLPGQTPTAREASSPAFAKALTQLATSSDYGAPTSRRTGPEVEQPANVAGSDLNASLRSAATAAIDVGDARLVGLLGVMVLTLVAGVALATGRRQI